MELLNSENGWIFAICLAVLGIAVCFVLVYFVNRKVNIKTSLFSIEQKEKEEVAKNNDIRLTIFAQIREYENYTGQIERILYKAFCDTFQTRTREEGTCLSLLCTIIRKTLEKQLMLDIISNHIIDKDDDELKIYNKEKCASYKNRIYNFIANYSTSVLPERDLTQAIEDIDIDALEEIYLTIYRKVVQIARNGGVL